ncbi:MAG: triose-phosphate isomerase [Burkholderiales bacterium]|nr:triose-phosphate isomerase [Burkholderiales bacterium]
MSEDIAKTSQRTPWVIGNWKMNGGLAANQSLLAAMLPALNAGGGRTRRARVGVCAPFPYLAQLQSALEDTGVAWGAQDVSDKTSGAFTGQVSAGMLAEFGVGLALIGHSERRQYNGESNVLVAAKAAAALAAGITPVICVGETLAEREAGQHQSTVAAQLAACAPVLRQAGSAVIVAYEPVWAIGTGKTASPAEAQAMHAFIRDQLRLAATACADCSVLYGGSVKASNARELFAQPDIDGGLIGGASLIAADFLAIVAAA